MFRKILIANRGEIAVRVIRAARELGIQSVAVYSTCDRESMHVLLSDQAVCIGPAVALKSYLNPVSIISAAALTGCDAIHPGYGFLSENAQFAETVASCGLSFIGPKTEHIRKMGDKIQARLIAKKLNIPIIPGTENKIQGAEEAQIFANKIGYPVLIKAAGGGGGRGMRVIHNAKEMADGFVQTQKEVISAFGNGDMYIEKYLLTPRHIEVQILGDGKGGVRHYSLRDCSVQRRHQKLIEEAPPVRLPGRIHKQLIRCALKLGHHLKYLGAGTVEFLVDGPRYYFIEMNTRIQVEHPVSEFISQSDLIQEQIIVAAEHSFRNLPPQPDFSGHSIECRINAEDANTFLPSSGVINGLHMPGGPGVRVDTFLYDQYRVLPYYDSLLAKIICWDKTRSACIAKMRRALKETIIRGISTNIELHRKILDTPEFVKGTHTTAFMKKLLAKA